ncbi:Endo-1,4-beta-xylanase A [Thalassocella blandensis]|nr:Endo-1,4-beta-xylanase A [Thalassocella blandensis]
MQNVKPQQSRPRQGKRPIAAKPFKHSFACTLFSTTLFPLLCQAQIHVEAESAYTSTGIEFEITEDAGGGQNAGWIDDSDFLVYRVEVPTTGNYRVDYRVASTSDSGRIILGEDGTDLTSAIVVPNTGDWQNWNTISHQVSLTAGVHDLVIWAQTGGWNFNWFELTALNEEGVILPGKIEAEDFNSMSGIDTEATTDTDGGDNVGWIDAGDWLEYLVTIEESANYRINARVASETSGGAMSLSVDGQNLAQLSFEPTGAWQNWSTVSGNITLPAGQHRLRVSAAQAGWNLNWLSFEKQNSAGTQLPMIRQQGKYWAVNGEPIHLKGLNLGNWLQLEFWMMNTALSTNNGAINDQCTLEAELDRRFGYNERERLMDVFRNSWMTDRDWDNIAALGFNVVRLPFPANLIEDENRPYTLRSDAWEYLDKAIARAAERGIYTILDLHGAAGSQGWEHHSGCSNRNWYWNGGNGQPASFYQDRTHWLWDMIAQRYRGNGNVAAYGLLNEPWGTDQYTLGQNLASLYQTVRAKDPEHIVIMHGHNSGLDSFPMPGNDVAYEMHFYPGLWGWREGENQTTVNADWLHCSAPSGWQTCDWVEKMEARQAPFLIGEFQPWTLLGRDGGEITRKTFDVFNGNGWAATAWSYKTVSTGGHSGNGNNGWPWGMITNRTGFGNINISNASTAQIENWFRQFASQELVTHPDIAYWMNYQASNDSRIHAEHFSMNSGAGMEATSDPNGGEFNAAYLDTGDWMVYRVNVTHTGNYQLRYRVASPAGGSVSASIHNGTSFGSTSIPATGGWQNWQTIDGPSVYLEAGEHNISLYVANGGWNINYWELISQ